jgi:hypothetical protein
MLTFSREELDPVAVLLIKKHDQPSFTRAVTAAVKNLLGPEAHTHANRRASSTKPRPVLPCSWTLSVGVLTITSASAEHVEYTCTGDRCTCKTLPSRANPAGWCWHRAAWHLILTERAISDPFYFLHPVSRHPLARVNQATSMLRSQSTKRGEDVGAPLP